MAYCRDEEDAKKVEMWMEWLDDESMPIQKILYEVFDYVGAGTAKCAVHCNTLELVFYAMRCARNSTDIPNDDRPQRVCVLSKLETVVKRLELIAERVGTTKTEVEARWARMLYEDAQRDISSMRYHNIYQIVINSWEALKGWSVTYELLSNMVCIQADWTKAETWRSELSEIIEWMASEW